MGDSFITIWVAFQTFRLTRALIATGVHPSLKNPLDKVCGKVQTKVKPIFFIDAFGTLPSRDPASYIVESAAGSQLQVENRLRPPFTSVQQSYIIFDACSIFSFTSLRVHMFH